MINNSWFPVSKNDGLRHRDLSIAESKLTDVCFLGVSFPRTIDPQFAIVCDMINADMAADVAGLMLCGQGLVAAPSFRNQLRVCAWHITVYIV